MIFILCVLMMVLFVLIFLITLKQYKDEREMKIRISNSESKLKGRIEKLEANDKFYLNGELDFISFHYPSPPHINTTQALRALYNYLGLTYRAAEETAPHIKPKETP